MTDEHRLRSSDVWGPDARALALQAQVLSGQKLDQLVRRLQRQTGRSREACWRFVLQFGLKSRDEHRRWTEEELESLRETLSTHSVNETARMLGRSPNAVRCTLRRNNLKVRDIRCDCFSVEALARILRIRKSEIHAWIEKEWLQATTQLTGKRQTHVITPESFRALYTHHLRDLLEQKRITNVALFEAFYNFCFVPKHTIGTQLLTVRRDKRERAAFAATQDEDDFEEENDESEEGFNVSLDEDVDSEEGSTTYSE
jgi:DNA-binding CsgD family transcriptional regulator